MSTSVAIGEFSRLTHLTVKTLRYYHEQGLLVPYAVDGASGYRRYSVDQVPDALLIGRLRSLDMPLAEVRRVLESTDTAERDAAIADHLRRMEAELGRTRAIVASLRGLLTPAAIVQVQRRTVPDLAWSRSRPGCRGTASASGAQQTFTELYQGLRTATDRSGRRAVRRGVLHRGRGRGDRVRPGRGWHPAHPRRHYAVAVHAGPFLDFDKTYAALGSHVAARETAATGPIREIYLVSPPDTTDEANFRTEVCWPINHRAEGEATHDLHP